MARVLISFLGTSDYTTVNYRFPVLTKDEKGVEMESFDVTSKENNIETDLFFTALKNRYNIDRVYLIGTVRSNWAKVFDNSYNALTDNEKKQYDWDITTISDEIYEQTGFQIDYNAKLDFPHKEKIEQLLGKGSKIILINYGITQAEIKSNSEKILNLDLSSTDEVYVDITHGFRSLPMSIMNTLIYLKYVKSVTIQSIFYGLMDNECFKDNSDEVYVPVVDLKSLIATSDWIMGAYAFKEFGKGYKVAELLGYKPDDDNKNDNRGKTIFEFSDVMGADFLSGIKPQVNKLSGIKNKELYDSIAGILIPNVIEDYLNKFPQNIPNSKFQYEIAKWHCEHMNYSSAIMDILEALLSKVKEICGTTNSEYAKIYLGKKNNDPKHKPDSNTIIENIAKLEKELKTKKYNTKDIVTFLDNQRIRLEQLRNNARKQEDKDEINKILPQIRTEGKNAFSLVYSINVFRNSIAHQTDLTLFSIDDIIKITELCIGLLGKLI